MIEELPLRLGDYRDHITLTVVQWDRSGYDHRCRVEVRVGDFHATTVTEIGTHDLRAFYDALRPAHRYLRGTATLTQATGGLAPFTLTVEVHPTGRATLNYELTALSEGADMELRLSIATDQSYLTLALQQLLTLLQEAREQERPRR